MRTRIEAHTNTKRTTWSRVLPIVVAVSVAACGGDSPFEPDRGDRMDRPPIEQPDAAGTAANSYTDTQVRPEGNVTETDEGYRVDGSLHIDAGDETITLADADLKVERGSNGRITSISGSAKIPSPHPSIGFADPVQADVGLFNGRWLNENRSFNIRLKDDTDYFVFHTRVKLGMELKGPNGESVSVSVGVPVGGQILFVMDLQDPMFYVYGASDLFGDTGFGWSLNSRIPFAPSEPVAGLGSFDGRNIRTGSFPIIEAGLASLDLSDGERVDNAYLPSWLVPDPYGMGASAAQIAMGGYEAGFNGTLELGLGLESKKKAAGKPALKLGVSIPLAHGSAGVFGDLSARGFRGHAYVSGRTSDNASWIPAPVLTLLPTYDKRKGLQASGYLKSDGEFSIDVDGTYSLLTPTGSVPFGGALHFSNEELSLTGRVSEGDDTFAVTGYIWGDSAGLGVEPPQAWVDDIADRVDADLSSAVADAQKAWDDVQQATSDYQFELSLRGLRSSLPGMIDYAKSALQSGIANELAKHRGTVYYSSLRSGINAGVAPYYRELDNLKAQANQITDNAATRAAIEAALRKVASMKTFTYTYRHKVLGVTVKTVTVTRTVMSQSQVNPILNAANNVKHIAATSSRMLSMQQIYNQVDSRRIFEKIQGDIVNGVVQIRSIGEFGFVVEHATQTYSMYVVIDGQRRRLGQIDIFDVGAMVVALTQEMIGAMTG